MLNPILFNQLGNLLPNSFPKANKTRFEKLIASGLLQSSQFAVEMALDFKQVRTFSERIHHVANKKLSERKKPLKPKPLCVIR